jgi:hypothetical protein
MCRGGRPLYDETLLSGYHYYFIISSDSTVDVAETFPLPETIAPKTSFGSGWPVLLLRPFTKTVPQSWISSSEKK